MQQISSLLSHNHGNLNSLSFIYTHSCVGGSYDDDDVDKREIIVCARVIADDHIKTLVDKSNLFAGWTH